MSAEALCLVGDAALLSLTVTGAFLSRRLLAGTLVYGGVFAICTAMLVLAVVELVGSVRCV